jgi:hypothetical protein
MREVELLRISMLRRFCIAAALLCPLGSASAQETQAASACWLIFSGHPKTYGRSDADEMMCLKSPTSGEVIESTLFGSVGGCSKVTVKREGGGTTFLLDFSGCNDKDTNHSISCPSLAGEMPQCVWTWEDNEVSSAYLRSCPPNWCSHGRDYGAH